MPNRMMLKGQWNEIKGSIRKTWGELTDDDLARVEGDWEQLLGAIQKRTGQARDAVERQLTAVVEKFEEETHAMPPGKTRGSS